MLVATARCGKTRGTIVVGVSEVVLSSNAVVMLAIVLSFASLCSSEGDTTVPVSGYAKTTVIVDCKVATASSSGRRPGEKYHPLSSQGLLDTDTGSPDWDMKGSVCRLNDKICRSCQDQV